MFYNYLGTPLVLYFIQQAVPLVANPQTWYPQLALHRWQLGSRYPPPPPPWRFQLINHKLLNRTIYNLSVGFQKLSNQNSGFDVVVFYQRVNRPVRCIYQRDFDVRSTGKRHGAKTFYKVCQYTAGVVRQSWSVYRITPVLGTFISAYS